MNEKEWEARLDRQRARHDKVSKWVGYTGVFSAGAMAGMELYDSVWLSILFGIWMMSLLKVLVDLFK